MNNPNGIPYNDGFNAPQPAYTQPKPKRGRNIVSIIVSIICSLGVVGALFLPTFIVKASSNFKFEMSMFDLLDVKATFTRMANKAAEVAGLKSGFTFEELFGGSPEMKDMMGTIEQFIGSLFITFAACAGAVILFKCLDKFTACRVLALLAAIYMFLNSITILGVALLAQMASEQAKSSVSGSSSGMILVEMGIAPLIVFGCSLLAVIFTAIGVKGSKSKKAAPAPMQYYQSPAQPNPYDIAPQPVPQQYNQYQPQTPAAPYITPDAPPQSFDAPPVTPDTPPAMPDTPPASPAAPVTPAAPAAPVPVQDFQPEEVNEGSIVCISGALEGMEIKAASGNSIMIGRDPASCNIVLPTDGKDVSRKHCTIVYNEAMENYSVTDLSSNGTYISGNRMEKDKETILTKGTVISLGNGTNKFILK